MARFHHAIVRGCLRIERVCLEVTGKGLVVNNHHGAWDCGQMLVAFVFAAVVLINMICYYGVHLIINNDSNEENEKHALDLVVIVDFATFCALVSFPFAGPIHRALGYFDIGDGDRGDGNGDPVRVQSSTMQLLQDKGTGRVINLVLASGLLYSVGEAIFFLPKMEQGVGYKVYYVFLIVTNIAVFYFSMLLVILSSRAIVVRLYRIEKQVESCLEESDPDQRDYNTFGGTSLTDEGADGDYQISNAMDANNSEVAGALEAQSELEPANQVMQWTHDYRLIRKDVHDLSQHFGFRMLLGLFLLTVDTSSLVANLWEELGESLQEYEIISFLAAYVANAVVITSACFSAAYLVMICAHHIGPKLAILAVRWHNVTPECQVLASAFLHGPIKIHVGNFEVGPEYANAISLWFLGLFLVVFGLKIPGEV